MVIITSDDDPYVLDYFIEEETKLPTLTEKNARFIKLVVRLDSNYAKDLDEGSIQRMDMI